MSLQTSVLPHCCCYLHIPFISLGYSLPFSLPNSALPFGFCMDFLLVRKTSLPDLLCWEWRDNPQSKHLQLYTTDAAPDCCKHWKSPGWVCLFITAFLGTSPGSNRVQADLTLLRFTDTASFKTSWRFVTTYIEQIYWCHFFNSSCSLHVSVSYFGNFFAVFQTLYQRKDYSSLKAQMMVSNF